MAITLTDSYQEVARRTGTWTGSASRDVTVILYARYDPDYRSTTSTRIQQKCTVIFNDGGFTGTWCSGSGHYQGAYYQNPSWDSKQWVWEDRGTFNGTGASTYDDVAYDYWTVKCNNGAATATLGTRWVYSYYGMTASNTEFTVDVELPSMISPATGGHIDSVVPGVDSFTLTGGVTSMGSGATETEVVLMVLTAPYVAGVPHRQETFYTLTATKTITSSSEYVGPSGSEFSIVPNTQYYAGVYAWNGNIAYRWPYPNPIYTLPLTPTSVAEYQAQTYDAYNKAKVYLRTAIPADGGALSKTLQFRTQKTGGSWTAWQTLSTSIDGTAQNVDEYIVLDTDSTYNIEVRSYTTAGSSPSVASLSVSTLATHQGPIFSDFTYQDTNPAVSQIVGSNQILVQNQSRLKVSIPVADKAQARDNIPVESYLASFNGVSQTKAYSSSADVDFDFGLVAVSGTRSVAVSAVDALDALTEVSKNITILAWSAPSVEASYVRTGDTGAIDLSVAGEYSPLIVSGIEKNSLSVSYRISDENGVIRDWTTIPISVSGGEFAGLVANIDVIDYAGTYLIEIKAEDVFAETVYSLTVSALEGERKLSAPQYDIEIWSRQGQFIADISRFIQGDLSIKWTLDDIEELSFNVSLDAMEFLNDNNVAPQSVLTPYAHDVRIRRNGKYVVGCQIVQANLQINNDQIPVVQVRATGFLNIFKDQYISEPMAGYTYPEMAHKLINRAQHADCLIKNPTGDIDASYWISPSSTVTQTSVCVAGAGAIQCYHSSGWTGVGSQMNVKAGTPINIDIWVSGAVGDVYIRERNLISTGTGQGTMLTATLSSAGTYTHLTGTYTTLFDNGYIYIEQNQHGTAVRIDNCFVSRADDEDSLNNHYVGCIYSGLDDTTGGTGHNYATTGYISNREYAYELQNVKDAIMDLVQMGDDQFDFEFTPDRIFNTYDRKGSDRTDVEILYPGNVDSMTVERSAAELANKVQNIGSGIGDERLEVWALDNDSRAIYGTRESVITNNNVSLEETLQGQADGILIEQGDLTRNITATIKDGSINVGNVETGDVLPVKIGNYLGVLSQSTDILESIEGWYKIQTLNLKVSQDGVETLQLTLKYEGDFDES